MSHFFKMGYNLFKKSKNPKDKNQDKVEGLAPKFSELPVENKVEGMKEMIEKEDGKIRNLGKLFVGGLSNTTTTKELEAYFSCFGEVADSIIPRFPKTGKSQGFAFVTFVNPEDAKAALQTEVHVLDGKLVDVRPFGKKPPALNKENRVFLGGLPHAITEKNIMEFFSRYGEVVDVVIPREKNSKEPKGYAFLSFKEEDAMKKCEADRFVFIGGRRVQIKKAVPQIHCDKSDNMSTLSPSDEYLDQVFEVAEDEGNDDEDTMSSASGTEFLAIEQNPALRALFENYFIQKLASFDIMNDKKLNNESDTFNPRDSNVSEVERLLADFLIAGGSKDGTSGQNLIEFSDEDTECENETESSDDDDSHSCDGTTFNPKMSEVPCKDITGKPVQFSKGNSYSKASVSDDSESSLVQKSPPLQIRNSEGFLMCTVCQWISPNDSVETFLAHCKTSVHKTKLKDRFPSEQTNKQSLLIDTKQKLSSEKPVIETKKRQKKVKKIQEDYKKGPQKQPAAKATVDKNNRPQTDTQNKKKDPKQETPVTNKKIHALAKGMSCILPFSDTELMCTMCNKKIPRASEFDVLMKNVSVHLQSKIHLKKLSETENSMMSSYKVKSTLDICKKNEKQKQDNQSAKGKKVQKGPDLKSTCGKKASVDEKPQNAPSNIVPLNNPQKEKPVEKKQKTVTVSNPKFMCLPCNVTCLNTESFNVHLGLKSHSDTLISKNVKADVSLTNMGKCKGCRTFLFGSLYQINKHCSKCTHKKN